jgi:hypothetical protein
MGRSVTSSFLIVTIVTVLSSCQIWLSSSPVFSASDDDERNTTTLMISNRPKSTLLNGHSSHSKQRQKQRGEASKWNPHLANNNEKAVPTTHANLTLEILVCTTLDDELVSMPRKVPSFIIIGAQKASTSAVGGILKQHPNIASTFKREPHFFDSQRLPGTSAKQACSDRLRYLQENFDIDKYMTSLNHGNRLHFFEKTPRYLRHPGAARKVHSVLGDDVKIIAVLRNPVDRSYSHYKMEKQRRVKIAETFDKLVATEVEALRKANLTKAVPFEEFDPSTDYDHPEQQYLYTFQLHEIPSSFATRRNLVASSFTQRQYKVKPMQDSSLYTSMYATQLAEWLQYYPLNQSLLVVRSEELLANASAVLGRVQAFLEVPHEKFSDSVTKRNYNPLKGGRGWREGAAIQVDEPSEYALAYLKRFFQPHNDELGQLLGKEWKDVWS